jgi:hypothetical protein
MTGVAGVREERSIYSIYFSLFPHRGSDRGATGVTGVTLITYPGSPRFQPGAYPGRKHQCLRGYPATPVISASGVRPDRCRTDAGPMPVALIAASRRLV